MREPTAEEVGAYGDAWHDTPQGKRGDRTRAGLRAVFALQHEHELTVPRALVDALDAIWDAVQEGEHGAWLLPEATDREVIRLIGTLEDAQVGRASVAAMMLRSLIAFGQTERVFGGPPSAPHPEQPC